MIIGDAFLATLFHNPSEESFKFLYFHLRKAWENTGWKGWLLSANRLGEEGFKTSWKRRRFTIKGSLSSTASKFKLAMNNMSSENRKFLTTAEWDTENSIFHWEQNGDVFRVYLNPCVCGGGTTAWILNSVVVLFFSLTQNLMWLRVMPPICSAASSEMAAVTWLMARNGGAVVSTETLHRSD